MLFPWPVAALPPLANLWPIALPLLAGAAAVYLLLPRPQAVPVLSGALLGLVAVVLLSLPLRPQPGQLPLRRQLVHLAPLPVELLLPEDLLFGVQFGESGHPLPLRAPICSARRQKHD